MFTALSFTCVNVFSAVDERRVRVINDAKRVTSFVAADTADILPTGPLRFQD